MSDAGRFAKGTPERESWEKFIPGDVDQLFAAIDARDALIAQLREALEPFAINVRNVLTQVRDDGEICVEALIPLGDIARACSALAAAAQARKGETK